MSIHNARLRALLILGFAALCCGALGTQASADDGTPAPPARAVPLARAIPRTFTSYDSLISAAGAVATDQASLSAQLAAARTQSDIATTIVDPRLRGGLVHTFSDVADGSIAALREQIAGATITEARLLANGAGANATTPWLLPLAGEVSQPFGPTPYGFEPARLYRGTFFAHFHEGLDILADGGTPIIAPARGRVVYAGRMMDGAVVVVLAHDNGLVSLYAHLEDGSFGPTIKAGDIIEAGQRVGSVGLTGLTTGYHLHWAVYRDGEPLDPLSTLGG